MFRYTRNAFIVLISLSSVLILFQLGHIYHWIGISEHIQLNLSTIIVLNQSSNSTKHFLHKLNVSENHTSKFHRQVISYPLNIDLWEAIRRDHDGKPLHSPINKHKKFAFTILNSSYYCPSLDLVLIVKSKVSNIDNRRIIRSTWANKNCWNDWTVKIVFLLGLTVDPNLTARVHDEATVHQDIIQQNFIDNYFNNTIKTMMGFQWLATYCGRAKFAFFSDDDFLINPRNTMTYLQSTRVVNTEYFIAGYRQGNSAPFRNKKLSELLYVPYSELDWEKWPPFVSAGAYIVNAKLANILYLSMKYVKFFRMDDVYIGIILYKLGIDPINAKNISVWIKPITDKNLIASHSFAPDFLQKYWNTNKESLCKFS